MELNIHFVSNDTVVVDLGHEKTNPRPFQNPLTAKDREDLRWYIETYASQPLEHDQTQVERIKARLPSIGKALFQAVFGAQEARRLFNRFQDPPGQGKLITLSAADPTILSLPWELLHEAEAPDGTHLFHEHINLHRCYAGATQGRGVVHFTPKARLRILFVVSRPDDAGFINPRADAGAVLDAVEQRGQNRIDVEFLRPATLDALLERLQQEPPIDVLHFDGHGVFDEKGGILSDQNRKPAGKEANLRRADEGNGPPNTGYLLFEDAEGKQDLVSAATLGANLHRHPLGLLILSACQSATLGQADPLGSVAARLTAAGIPAVLAMSYSVLVKTTEALFGAFYQQVAAGKPLGGSLETARRYVANHPEKHSYWQGEDWVTLKLHDWFVPALYQGGGDGPLLAGGNGLQPATEPPEDSANIRGLKPAPTLPPRPEAGFFGRTRELWDIERWFADTKHPARRISLTGFGGQGKTALALEAGRWLLRTGLFRAAAFVNYAEVPSRDAVAVAVAELAAMLDTNLADANAARQALAATPTLLILDNLEAVDDDSLRLLLDAAQAWSEAGGSRVLLTSRRSDFRHPGYRLQGTWTHRRIALDGLGEVDALDWHEELRQLPPSPSTPAPRRKALAQLFAQVRFHPLSIRVLAVQLKTRRIADLGGRLETLLGRSGLQPVTATTTDGASIRGLKPAPTFDQEDHPTHLVASLHLSLERLAPAARASLPKLGVFQGGFWEPMLEITELEASDWAALRQQLETAALLEAESLEGINPPFLRFHPTLAPLLWLELDAAEQVRLSTAHSARYHALAGWLYHEDDRNPHAVRAIARRELPNLLHAVHAALALQDSAAVEFANYVNLFLNFFGLRREQAELARLAQQQAQDSGTRAWFLAESNRGEQLLSSGQVAEAAAVFQALLEKLGDAASYERVLINMENLPGIRGNQH
jgi:hypothetical protein